MQQGLERRLQHAPRAQVFVSCSLLILVLAQRGILLWFILENVTGILKEVNKLAPFHL